MASLAVLSLGVIAISPPGQAVAERFGELVGIGDEPSRARELPFDPSAVVIGVGTSPNGTRFEIVAASDMLNIFSDSDPTTCISLDLPEIDGPVNAGCMTDALARSIDREVVAPTAFLGSPELGSDRLIVDGIASRELASAQIEYRAESGAIERFPVEVTRLGDKLAKKIRAPRRAAFFVSFLPEDLVPTHASSGVQEGPSADHPIKPSRISGAPAADALGRITLVAYDNGGDEIARETLDSHPLAATMLYRANKDRSSEERGRDHGMHSGNPTRVRHGG